MPHHPGSSIYAKISPAQNVQQPHTGEVIGIKNLDEELHDVHLDRIGATTTLPFAEIYLIDVRRHGSSNRRIKDSWTDGKGNLLNKTEAWVHNGFRYLDHSQSVLGKDGGSSRSVTIRYRTNMASKQTASWQMKR